MQPPEVAHVGPLPTHQFNEIARLLSRHGAVALSGTAGSGRRTTADTLVTHCGGSTMTRMIDADFVGAERTYGVLLALDLIDDRLATAAPDIVARTMVDRCGTATIVVEHADRMDTMSLRALSIAARKSHSVRVILTIDRTIAQMHGWRDIHGIPVADIAPLDRDGVLDLVERMLGAQPAILDTHLLLTLGAGSFRATRWLVELARVNGGIVLDHGRCRVRLPALADTDAVPDWSLDPDLVTDPSARLLSLAGSVPISSLDDLGIAERCLELERLEALRTIDQHVEFATPALAYDISGRIGAIEQRQGVARLLNTLNADEIDSVSAETLWRRAVAAGLEPSDTLTTRAIVAATDRGQHAEALQIAEHIQTITLTDTPRLAFAAIMVGDEKKAATFTPEPTAEALEATGIAYAIGELRHGPDSVSARALNELITHAQQPSAAMLRGYTTLLRPHLRMDEKELQRISANNETPLGTRARSLRALALRSWMDGRPVRANDLVTQADRLDTGSSADAAISLFIHAASELLRPNIGAAMDALLTNVRPGDMSRIRALLSATLGLYSGGIPIARMSLEGLVSEGIRHDPILEPITWPMLSMAHSMLGDDASAHAALEAAYETSSASPFVTAAAHHVRGIAVTQLATPNSDEGLAAYSAAAEASEPLDFRLLFGFATYRTALELDPQRRRTALRTLSALHESDRPLDGIPGILADLADALSARDARRLFEIYRQLRQAGLIQEAKVLATRLLADAIVELPTRVLREIAQTAKHRFDKTTTSNGLALTPREQDVARLLLKRHTDREIAAKLGCSYRTVNVHLGHILRKLNLRSRHDVTPELLHRHGIVGTHGTGPQ